MLYDLTIFLILAMNITTIIIKQLEKYLLYLPHCYYIFKLIFWGVFWNKTSSCFFKSRYFSIKNLNNIWKDIDVTCIMSGIEDVECCPVLEYYQYNISQFSRAMLQMKYFRRLPRIIQAVHNIFKWWFGQKNKYTIRSHAFVEWVMQFTIFKCIYTENNLHYLLATQTQFEIFVFL